MKSKDVGLVDKIKKEIANCKKGQEECTEPDDILIYQGWVEGLEFVLKLLK